jgi:hypothetical protein
MRRHLKDEAEIAAIGSKRFRVPHAQQLTLVRARSRKFLLTGRIWATDNLHQQAPGASNAVSDGIVLAQRLIPARAEQVQTICRSARAIIEARPDLEHSFGD